MSATADSDPLAPALAAIRAEGYLDGPDGPVPRLLKAVEAALDHHNREMAMNPATRILAAECARCCQPWPCREVRAITRELTGGTDER